MKQSKLLCAFIALASSVVADTSAVQVKGLYWQASSNLQPYAYDTVSGAFSGAVSVARFDEPWRGGFELLLSHKFNNPSFDVSLAWTNFNSTSFTSITDPATTLVSPYSTTYTNAAFAFISGKWALRLNTIYALASKTFAVNAFSFTPKAGIATTFINQSIAINSFKSGFVSVANYLSENSSSFGIGPQLGCGLGYLFPFNIELNFDVLGDIGYRHQRTRANESKISTSIGTTVALSAVMNDEFNPLQSHLYAGLGAKQHLSFKKFGLEYGFAFDFHTYFDQENFFEFSFDGTQRQNANLYLKGISGYIRAIF